ncbi:MAG: hypothetical protein JRI32_08195, partial [Deltaproteobacteria bacterium]|nr:hypothetical protein [Deltaproteobacteria bacterium]
MKNLGIRILAYITFTCLIFMVFTLEISYEGKRLGIAHSFAQEHRDVHPIKVKENEKAALTHPPGLREIHLSPYAQKLAEIQVQRVERKFVTREVRMVGKVDYDETRLAYIAAWVPGRIDRLY